MGSKERTLLVTAMVLSPVVIKTDRQLPDISLPMPPKAVATIPHSTYSFTHFFGQPLTFTGPEGRGSLNFHGNSPFEGEYTLTLDPTVNFRRGVSLNIWDAGSYNFDLSLLLLEQPDGEILLKTGYGRATDPIYPVRETARVIAKENNALSLKWGTSPQDKEGIFSRFRDIIWNGKNLLSRLVIPNLQLTKPRS